MPKMSKWVADLSEIAYPYILKKTVISEVLYFDDALKHVRFQGDDLKEVVWQMAQEIEFRVSETEYRHYTPFIWNPAVGFTDVLFYLHGWGPGSLWASNLAVGDEVTLIGPGGKYLQLNPGQSLVMLGDETSISTFKGIQNLVNKDCKTYAVLELHREAMEWPKRIGLDAELLEQIPAYRGWVMEHWLMDFLANEEVDPRMFFFLSGNANTIKKLRRILAVKNVSLTNILAKPYWLEGKEGL